ncbi:MAG: VOC family protein [Baekduia sp.]
MGLLQVAQKVTDLERAAAWYGDLLGAEPVAEFDPPGLIFFDLDGVRLLLDRNGDGSRLYLEVDDVEMTVGRLRSNGSRVVSGPHMTFRHEDGVLGPAGHEEWQAFVEDSEGNAVGLVEHRVMPPG